MELFNQVFQNIATMLLIPVLIVLSVLFVQCLFHLGSFIGEKRRNREFEKNWKRLKTFQTENMNFEALREMFVEKEFFVGFLKDLSLAQRDEAKERLILQEWELAMEGKLQSLKNFMRLGPMLGLMGTLIPMGPALTGLASGDVATMAGHMQVAFSTTVIGVFLGAMGFVLFYAEKKQMKRELMVIEFVLHKTEGESRGGLL